MKKEQTGERGHLDDLLLDVRDTANVVMEFKEQLAARLRIGGPPPSESWWRRYDEAKRRWVELDADVTDYFGESKHLTEAERGRIRSQAVENVDARYGYTVEFSNAPNGHLQDYDDEEQRLLGAANIGSSEHPHAYE